MAISKNKIFERGVKIGIPLLLVALHQLRVLPREAGRPRAFRLCGLLVLFEEGELWVLEDIAPSSFEEGAVDRPLGQSVDGLEVLGPVAVVGGFEGV